MQRRSHVNCKHSAGYQGHFPFDAKNEMKFNRTVQIVPSREQLSFCEHRTFHAAICNQNQPTLLSFLTRQTIIPAAHVSSPAAFGQRLVDSKPESDEQQIPAGYQLARFGCSTKRPRGELSPYVHLDQHNCRARVLNTLLTTAQCSFK